VWVEPDAHIVVNEGDWLREVARLEVGEPAAVVCLENTHTRRGGTVLTAAETAELASRAPRAHLDGARLANAAVALGVPVADLAAPVDTAAFALNKGLGGPFGALLAGDADVIAHARTHLKTLGGATIHKLGLLAAAGLVALDGIDRLAEDHRRARDLAREIGAAEPETNIVLADLGPDAIDRLAEQGVLAWPAGDRIRFVTHHEISDADVAAAAQAVSSGSRT
jgi:threonine aldolase